MAVKPTNLAEWATGAAPIVEPTTPQKQAGWPVDFKPPAQWFNWWMNIVYTWVVWLDAFESEAHTWSAIQTFGNAATFNAAIIANATVNLNDVVQVGATGTFDIQKPIDFNIATAATPILRRSQQAATPHLLFEQLVDATRKLRIYITVDRGLEATYNARYSGGNWLRDVVADAWRLSLGKGMRHYKAPAGGGGFTDAAWIQIFSTFDPLGSAVDGLPGVGYVWFGNSALGEVATGRHIPQLAWTNLTLSANLTPGANPPQYFKDTTGRVWFRGFATANTTIATNTQIATQPVGSEIQQVKITTLMMLGSTLSGKIGLEFETGGRIDLQTDGSVTVINGSTISFEDLNYRSV
jgi:hypothetical protein